MVFKTLEGMELELMYSKYVTNQCVALKLVTGKIPPYLKDDYHPNDWFCDVTTNAFGLQPDEFITDFDFMNEVDTKVIQEVMEFLIGQAYPDDPYRYIENEIGQFPVYKFAKDRRFPWNG